MGAVRTLHSVLAWGGSVLLVAGFGVIGPQVTPAFATELEQEFTTTTDSESIETPGTELQLAPDATVPEPEQADPIEEAGTAAVSAKPSVTLLMLSEVHVGARKFAVVTITDDKGKELCSGTGYPDGDNSATFRCELTVPLKFGQTITVRQTEEGKTMSPPLAVTIKRQSHWANTLKVTMSNDDYANDLAYIEGTPGAQFTLKGTDGKVFCQGTLTVPNLLDKEDTTGWAKCYGKIIDNPSNGTWTQTVDGVTTTGLFWSNENPDPTTPIRFAGSSRYETSVSLYRTQANPKTRMPFGYQAPLFVVTGQGFADALATAPAVKKIGGAMVLTAKNSLSEDVTNIIAYDQASAIYIIGGKGVISDAVADQIKKLAPSSVKTIQRISGADRYKTSEAIYTKFFAGDKNYKGTTAFIATGTAFPDALSASAVAGALNSPVILVDGKGKTGLSSTLTSSLKAKGISQAIIVGGPGAVSNSIESQLKKSFTTQRKYGPDRYTTNGKLNDYLLAKVSQKELESSPSGRPTIWVATGSNFPDALSAAPFASNRSDILWLAKKDCLPQSMSKGHDYFFGKDSLYQTKIVGGTGVLSTKHETAGTMCPK